ncbi:MAG: transposase [Planctomycetota bacterium]|nr:transposase [Planctomycetota bacterium]
MCIRDRHHTAQAGILIAQGILNLEVERLAGPRYSRGGPDVPVRWGHEDGYIVFAGRKVPIRRPRVRLGASEVPLESYRQLQSDGAMQRAVMGRMVAGISTRQYERVIEDFIEGYGIGRSSVSRHFVAASAEKLRELCERRLDGLGIVVLVVDGIEVGGQTVVVAVGVDEGGRKYVLGFWDGATENTAVCEGLFDDLERRGLDMGRRYLFVIDGSLTLGKAIRKRFGADAAIQRCQSRVHGRKCVDFRVRREGRAVAPDGNAPAPPFLAGMPRLVTITQQSWRPQAGSCPGTSMAQIQGDAFGIPRPPGPGRLAMQVPARHRGGPEPASGAELTVPRFLLPVKSFSTGAKGATKCNCLPCPHTWGRGGRAVLFAASPLLPRSGGLLQATAAA